jgi:hypothetical protein
MHTGSEVVSWKDTEFLPFYFCCILAGIFLPASLALMLLWHFILFGLLLFIPDWYRFILFVYSISIVYTILQSLGM